MFINRLPNSNNIDYYEEIEEPLRKKRENGSLFFVNELLLSPERPKTSEMLLHGMTEDPEWCEEFGPEVIRLINEQLEISHLDEKIKVQAERIIGVINAGRKDLRIKENEYFSNLPTDLIEMVAKGDSSATRFLTGKDLVKAQISLLNFGKYTLLDLGFKTIDEACHFFDIIKEINDSIPEGKLKLHELKSIDLRCYESPFILTAHIQKIAEHFPGLKSFSLCSLPFNNEEFSVLSRFTELEHLDLENCFFLENEHLAYLSPLTKLKHLSLSGNSRLRDVALLNLKELTELEHLNLESCAQITDLGISYLKQHAKLKTLIIKNCANIAGETTAELPPNTAVIT